MTQLTAARPRLNNHLSTSIRYYFSVHFLRTGRAVSAGLPSIGHALWPMAYPALSPALRHAPSAVVGDSISGSAHRARGTGRLSRLQAPGQAPALHRACNRIARRSAISTTLRLRPQQPTSPPHPPPSGKAGMLELPSETKTVIQ